MTDHAHGPLCKPRYCEHGQLTRQCPLCKATPDLREARERIAELERECRRYQDMAARFRERAVIADSRAEKAEQELARRCEHCGGKVSSYPNGCPGCGAPQCCQSCCDRANLRERAEKAKRALADALKWTADDKPLPEDDAIHAAHPEESGRHDLYAEAMRLVGAKRSKGALVDLVNWLLVRAEKAEQSRDAALCPTAQEEHKCETCKGEGTIDERLGGIRTSNPAATCPDCDGRGHRGHDEQEASAETAEQERDAALRAGEAMAGDWKRDRELLAREREQVARLREALERIEMGPPVSLTALARAALRETEEPS